MIATVSIVGYFVAALLLQVLLRLAYRAIAKRPRLTLVERLASAFVGSGIAVGVWLVTGWADRWPS